MYLEVPHKNLDEIAEIIYNDESSFGELLMAVKAYGILLSEATGFDIDVPEAQTDIFTDSGKVIASKWARLCVDDYLRTKRFSNGLYKAILSKKEEGKEKIHILYAGTGPFATLVLPLTRRFSPNEISFTLLELNDHSFQNLEKVVAHFGIEDYITDMEKCDATTYKVSDDSEVDILLTETMTHGLKSEHQVSISYNLLSQLSEDTILIPEEIQLDLVAVNSEIQDANARSMDEPKPYYRKLGRLFTLSKSEIKTHSDSFKSNFPNFTFPEKLVEVPADTNRKYNFLAIGTYIKIFGSEVLDYNDSGLTVMLNLMELNPMMTTVSEISGSYVCGENPGLNCRIKS